MGSECSVVKLFLNRHLSLRRQRYWLRYITETVTRLRIFYARFRPWLPGRKAERSTHPVPQRSGVRGSTSRVDLAKKRFTISEYRRLESSARSGQYRKC